MRIAYVSDQILPQDATDTHQLVAMAAAFGQVGAEVELWIPRRSPERVPTTAELARYYEVDPTFSITTLPRSWSWLRGLEKAAHARRAVRALSTRAVDLIYTRNLPVVVAGLRYGRAPLLYETYRAWPRQWPGLAPLFGWIGRQPGFLGAVLHSALAAESYAAAGIDPARLLVAHNGHDPRRLEPRLTQAQARALLGLPGSRSTVVYSGHIAPSKGLDVVLKLAARLPEVLFLLVGSKGPGPIEREARTLANVRMIPWGPFSQIRPYLYAADVLLIPPTARPLERTGRTVLPIKTFQYMASGRAIFAPSTPDLTEVLEADRTACLVPPDRIDAAFGALQELLADAGRREQLGQAACQQVDGMTWTRRAQTVLDFVHARSRSGGRP